MIFGVILIISGILIALYPPLLSLIVAALLVSAGILLVVMGYRYKRMARRFEDPFLDFFMKL
jgi:Flp pilus assembly protein TadB